MIATRMKCWAFLLTLGFAVGQGYNDAETSPPCLQPIVKGNCKGYIEQWAYDTPSGKCIRFTYTGCGGNQNRYKDEKSCSEQCSRVLRPALNVDEQKSEPETRPYPPRPRPQPQPEPEILPYPPRPRPRPQPKPEILIDRCNLPVAPGNCKRHQNVYHFDSSSGQCKRFVYTGCRGNQNRFRDEKECLAKCGNKVPIVLPAIITKPDGSENNEDQPPVIEFKPRPRPEIQPTYKPRPQIQPTRRPVSPIGPEILPIFVGPQCTLKPDPGMCMAHMPKWHYDSASGNCLRFIYGGCGGNDNRYPTEQACLDACQPSRNQKPKPLGPELIDRTDNNDKCSQPLAAGNCKAYINAWHFDNAAGRCKPFVYTGCKGNDNRFSDEKSCQNACSSKSPVIAPNKDINAKCLLPVAVGRCKARIPAWHFDEKSGSCKSFNYSGCQGNENRFADERTCQNTCRSVEEVKVNHGSGY